MNESPAVKWYYKPAWIIVAILAVGPFALPLVWISPKLRLWHKIALTFVVVLATLWLIKTTSEIYKTVSSQMNDLKDYLK